MSVYNLISFGGVFVLMGVAWALSSHRRVLNVRVIAFGVGLQFVLAGVVFWLPGSEEWFRELKDVVGPFIKAAQAGQRFVFGALANEANTGGFSLAVHALPMIIFFSALMGLLYYCGIMQLVIRGFAWVFTRLMRISGAESLCVASNIFVGLESATTIRPHLKDMTRSELCTILTAGMATVASTTLAIYITFLEGTFPSIAGHLISASLLSAPAAIVMSKLILPETGEPVTLGKHVKPAYQRESGPIEAIINGAMAGMKMLVGVCALLIAFLGLIAVIDLALGVVGTSLGALLGYVMYPLAVVMGVPPSDAAEVGQLLGTRMLATEIPAYKRLAELTGQGAMSPRSVVISAYALCGFAHVASMAIFVGGIAAIVPERRKDLARVGPRALLAATLACLMTGAVAGAFFRDGGSILVSPQAPAASTAPASSPATRPATAPAVETGA